MARPGQALVEYVLVIALVALALLTVLAVFQQSVAQGMGGVSKTAQECLTPGNSGAAPGRGGTPPGQCRKGAR